MVNILLQEQPDSVDSMAHATMGITSAAAAMANLQPSQSLSLAAQPLKSLVSSPVIHVNPHHNRRLV